MYKNQHNNTLFRAAGLWTLLTLATPLATAATEQIASNAEQPEISIDQAPPLEQPGVREDQEEFQTSIDEELALSEEQPQIDEPQEHLQAVDNQEELPTSEEQSQIGDTQEQTLTVISQEEPQPGANEDQSLSDDTQEQPVVQEVAQANASEEQPQNSEAHAPQQTVAKQQKPQNKPVNPSKLGLKLRSSSVIVYDPVNGEVLLERQPDKIRPIASLTKLMTAMVVLDAGLPMDEALTITKEDIDRLRHSRSRLPVGTQLTRHDMLQLALAASENRAAAALARTFPGGTRAFVEQMNNKALSLKLEHTHFVDSTGLHDENVSTAADLVKLTIAANEYPQINDMSTNGKDYVIDLRRNRKIEFRNTNRLVRDDNWEVNLSKTGYIMSAGYCLVMHTIINDRPLAVILLNSRGKYSKFGDANRIKKWLMKVDSHRPRISS